MGSRLRRGRKPAALAILIALFVPSIVVASETRGEYQEWKNRPWGVLEHFHRFFTHDLPPAPAWRCGYAHHIDTADGTLTVIPLLVGSGHRPRTEATAWDEAIEERIPLEIELAGFERVKSNDEAHALARHNPNVLFIGFTSTYHRGSQLNERMEGFACANLAIVTDHTECAGAILAHEVGHALGLRHSSDGLMRPRDVACGDRLPADQAAWILERYGPKVDDFTLFETAEERPAEPEEPTQQ